MKQKLNFYFDNFSRFTSKQLYYWILNKYLKSIFPVGNPSKIRIKEELKDNYQLVTKNISNLLCLENGEFIWDYGVSSSNSENKYYSSLLEKITAFNNSKDINIIDNFWLQNGKDHEEINNYQRFYLYNDVLKKNYDLEELFFRIIENWINKNPPFRNNAWNSFNCSIRIINWLKIFLNTSGKFKPENSKWIMIQESIYLQSINILKNIEYHIPGNHVIIQFFSLWLIGNIFTDWKISKELREFSEKKIEQEIEKEYLKSGLHFEQSFHYHVQVNLVCIYLLLATKKLNKNFSKKVINIIKKATELVEQFKFSMDILPMLGDNCYNFFHISLWEDIQNHEALVDLLFEKRKKISNITEIKNQYILADIGNSKVIFDIGNIGLNCNPGHGHSDILNLLFSYNDQAIFIDPGTRKYSNKTEDLFLKKSISHNTVSIDGQDQAKLWGFFRWAFLPENPIYSYDQQIDKTKLIADFYGFKHLGGFKHRREIVLSLKYLEILDFIEGIGTHNIFINFIIAPGFDINIQNNIILIFNEKLKVNISIESTINFELEKIPIEIYQNYNEPTLSNKIQISFLNSTFPFESKIKVIPYI